MDQVAQLHLLIPHDDPEPDGSLAQAMAAVVPATPPGSFVVLSELGVRFVVNVPYQVETPEEAQGFLADAWPRILSSAALVGAEEVASTVIHPGHEAYIDTERTALLDAQVISHITSWSLGWQYLAQAPLARLFGAENAPLVLSRYATMAALLVGHLSWLSEPLTLDEITAKADALPFPGDWQLMTSPAAQATLSYGPAAVFDQGEILDIAVVSHAFAAVGAAALLSLVEKTGATPAQAAALLGTYGPNADVIGFLSKV